MENCCGFVVSHHARSSKLLEAGLKFTAAGSSTEPRLFVHKTTLVMRQTYCYWSVATGSYGALMENCVRSARAAGVFKEFHVLTERPLKNCECYDAMECDKAFGLFKLHYLKLGMDRLSFDYFIWIDADSVFVRNPLDILATAGKSPLHVPLEFNLSTLRKETQWKGVPTTALLDLFHREGVTNQVYLGQSAFWIVRHEAIETVYDLAMGFWHKANEAGLLLDVSAALVYAMQMLCGDPEKHRVESAPELWASDDAGHFDGRFPDGTPWPWRHPLASGSIQIRPAIVHLNSGRTHRQKPDQPPTGSPRIDQLLVHARQCAQQGDHFEALQIYERLVRRIGDRADIWFEYGAEAAALLMFDIAEVAWQNASELAPQDAELHLRIGNRYKAARQREKARTFYERAAILAPGTPNPPNRLALLYEESNLLDEARETTLRCLSISPLDEHARYMHARLNRRDGNLPEAERQFHDLITSNPKDPEVAYAARMELANILDQLGNVDEAMRYLYEAKTLASRTGKAKRLADEFHACAQRHMSWVQALPKDILNLWSKSDCKEQRPAFPTVALLAGHPRSGTTLLEQVLAAHETIAALDEPVTFFNLIYPLIKRNLETALGLRPFLRQAYIQGLQHELGSKPDKLLLDKNPSLTLFLPDLLQFIPNLRLIVSLRDPRDVVLSCYFLKLPLVSAASATFLSLEGIAEHYNVLMETWLRVREWERLKWTESRYEDIIADLNKEGRRVTEFLGLSWNQKQIFFYESAKRNPIYSPTYNEVTRPIYSNSIGRWQTYERYLAPVLPRLERFCQAFGYE